MTPTIVFNGIEHTKLDVPNAVVADGQVWVPKKAEAKFKVGDRVRTPADLTATVTGILVGGSVNIEYDKSSGGGPSNLIAEALRLIEPAESWGVDPNGTYEKGVTRFAVKAGRHLDVVWPEGATAVYDAGVQYSTVPALSVFAECATHNLGSELPAGEDWNVPASALRLIEPLSKPKPESKTLEQRVADLEEMAAKHQAKFLALSNLLEDISEDTVTK